MTAIKKLIYLFALSSVIAGCNIEPIRMDDKDVIKGAPDWVNKGSMLVESTNLRQFRGVSFATPKADMALQKSIADDNSRAEVGKVLESYLDDVSNSYSVSVRRGVSRENDEIIYRHFESEATRQINEVVARQTDEAIARQFKADVSPQLKENITRQIKESSSRQIRNAIANQVDFSRQLEDDISNQIKDAVLCQIRNTAADNLSGVRIVGSWRDPQTNTIWSMSVLDLDYVKKNMAELKDMNVDLKEYFELNSVSLFYRKLDEQNQVNIFSRK